MYFWMFSLIENYSKICYMDFLNVTLDNFTVFHNAGENNLCGCTDNKSCVRSHYLRQNIRSIITININLLIDFIDRFSRS